MTDNGRHEKASAFVSRNGRIRVFRGALFTIVGVESERLGCDRYLCANTNSRRTHFLTSTVRGRLTRY